MSEERNYPMVVGPEYLGAPYPPFDPMSINESEFDFCMRFKEYFWEEEDGKPTLYWTCYDEVMKEKFVAEVKRCLEALGTFKGETVIILMRTKNDHE